jgi:threonine/homoserine/homoserine lactone efflux protein
VTPGLFLRGLAIGFAVAFALGPVGLLVIRRTIDRGWRYGFLSGLGVATADATYAAIAAFGLTALTGFLVGADRVLGIVGGAVLIVLALRGIRGVLERDDAAPAAERPSSRLDGPAGAWASMVVLTLTNPATILSFAALFASIGAGTGGPGGAVAVVAGVFTGSVAWWAILTALIAGLRARLTPQVVRWLNVASAVIIAGFGVVAIAIGIGG